MAATPGEPIGGTDILARRLDVASWVLLGEVNSALNHVSYTKALDALRFFLTDQDLNERNGRAIFERSSTPTLIIIHCRPGCRSLGTLLLASRCLRFSSS